MDIYGMSSFPLTNSYLSEGWLNHQAVYHGLSISSGLTQTWIWLISPGGSPRHWNPRVTIHESFQYFNKFYGVPNRCAKWDLGNIKFSEENKNLSISFRRIHWWCWLCPMKYPHPISPSNIPIQYPHQYPIECHQTIIFIHCSLSQLSQCQGSQRKQNSELWVLSGSPNSWDGRWDPCHVFFFHPNHTLALD